MKYKVTIVIIASLLLIGGSIGETLYIRNTFEEFENRLQAQMYEEYYELEEVKELAKWWEDKAETLEIFISVLQLNEITVTMGELIGAVTKEDYDSANALYDRIYSYSVRIKDMYMLKLNNIL